MSNQFVVSRMDPFGGLTRAYFEANNQAEAEKKVKDDLKGVEGAHKPDQKEGRVLFNKNVVKVSASSTDWKHTSVIGKVLRLFEKIISLLNWLIGRRSTEMDYRLFADLCSSNETLRQFPGVQSELSDVLDVTIKFLKKEQKREGISSALIDELILCKKWSREVEEASSLANPTKRCKQLRGCVAQIVKKIKESKAGDSILLPGGWHGARALYRVTKENDGTFTLKMVSQDERVQAEDSVEIAGKKKILAETTYTKVTEKDLTESLWWEQVLQIQLAPLDKSLPVGLSSIKRLFGNFEANKAEAPKDPKCYITPKASSTHGQNLWQLVDCVAFPNAKKTERLDRLHLRRDLDLFFQFYASSYKAIGDNVTVQLLLHEGIENITRKASLLNQRGVLDKSEIAFIIKELGLVRKTLDRKKQSNKIDTSKPKGFKFDYPTKQLAKPDDAVVVANYDYAAREAKALPAGIANAQLIEAEEVKFASFADAIGQFGGFKKRCEDLLDKNQHVLAQDLICDIFLHMPIPKGAECSGDESVRMCSEITELSKLLLTACQESRIFLPDHFAILGKMIAVQYEIAYANPHKAKLTNLFKCKYFERIVEVLTREYDLPHYIKVVGEKYKGIVKEIEKVKQDRYTLVNNRRNGIWDYSSKDDDVYDKTYQESELLGNIREIIEGVDFFIPILSSEGTWGRGNKNPSSQEKLFQSTIRPCKFTCFRQAIVHANVSKGSYGADGKAEEKNKYADIGSQMTPEAIADNPEYFAKELAAKTACKFDTDVGSVPDLKAEDLRDIFLVLTNKLSTAHIMGVVQDKPYLLSLPDFRSICYHALNGRSPNFYSGGENFKDDTKEAFSRFIEKQIPLLQAQGKIVEALFLIELQRTWMEKNKIDVKDFTPMLFQWVKDSLNPTHPLASHKNALFKEWIHHCKDKEELSDEEMQYLVAGRLVLRSTQADPYNTTPRKQQEIARTFERWEAPIEQAVKDSDAFRDACLDIMCVAQGVKIPDGVIRGSYPHYEVGHFSIDLSQGIFSDQKTGTTNKVFSTKVLRNPATLEAFSTQDLAATAAQTKVDGKKTLYSFDDPSGHTSRVIEEEGEEIRIYKDVELGGKKLVLQYLSREDFLPEKLTNLFSDNENFNSGGKLDGPKKALGFVWKLMTSSNDHFPSFLRNENYRFWVDPAKAHEVYVFDAKGAPIYKLQFANGVLEQGQDLRKKQSKLQPVHVLSAKGGCLAQFDDPRNILVWRDSSERVERIELVRFGLKFKPEGDHYVSTHPSFAGWRLVNDTSFLDKGLKGALVLEKGGQRKLVVPRDPLENGPKEPEFSFKQMVEMGKRFWYEQLPRPTFSDPLQELWHRDDTGTHSKFLTFDVNPMTNRLSSSEKNAGRSFLYLCLLSCYRGNFISAFEYLRIAETHITEHDEKLAEALKPIYEFFVSNPGSVAIKLQTALFQMKLAPQKEKQELVPFVAQLFKKYVEYGHKIPREFHLSKEDEFTCAEMVANVDPEFIGNHLPLIFHKDGKSRSVGELEFKKAERQEEKFDLPSAEKHAKMVLAEVDKQGEKEKRYDEEERSFERGVPGIIKLLFAREMFDAQVPNPRTGSFDAYSTELFSRNFFRYYTTLKENDPLSDAFQKVELHLKSIVKDELKDNQGPTIARILHHYLEIVIDVKRRGDAAQLPTLELECLKGRDQRNHQEREKDFDRMTDFLEALQKLEKKVAAPKEEKKGDEKEHIEKLEKMEETIRGYFGTLVDKRLSEAMGSFEEFLEKQKADPLPRPVVKASGGALMKAKSLEPFFKEEDALIEGIHKVPDIHDVPGEEPAIKIERDRLKEEVRVAIEKKKEEKLFVLDTDEKRIQCREVVSARMEEARKTAERERKTLLDLFVDKDLTAYQLQQGAHLVSQLDIADILKAVLQNDWETLKNALPKDAKVTEEHLKQILFAYIDASSQMKRCQAAIAFLDEMTPEKGGIQRSAADTVYRILTAERQYDPKAHLHLAVLELLLGFLMRKEQLEITLEMIKDPSCVKQAATGTGKTTVVEFLNAMLQADGQHLVAMVFPKPLYEENLAYLHQHLGEVAHRNVYRLDFQERDSLDLPGGGSLFKKVYEDLYRTIQEKGVVATTRQTLQALEKSCIKHIYTLSQLEPEMRDLKKMQHLVYSAKILQLFKKRMICKVDEFDSVLSPKDRQDLALDVGAKIQHPAFMRECALELYDLLREDETLGLEQNLQAERYKAHGEQAIRKLALKIAEGNEQLQKYFLSELSEAEEAAVCAEIEKKPPAERDRLAAMKDFITTFIPLALQKKEGQKYKRSTDGENTYNCESPGKAKEGSSAGETFEQMCYTAQDYWHKGVSEKKIRKEVEEYRNQAEKELNPLGKDLDQVGEEDAGVKYASVDQTPAGVQFQLRFARPLSQFPEGSDSKKAIEELAKDINANAKLKRGFLEEQLGRLSASPATISCTSANFCSMAKHVGGASATTGNPNAYSRLIHKAKVTNPGTVGEMVLILQEKTSGKAVETYAPEAPLEKVEEMIEKQGVHSFVDGGVALTGAQAKTVAKALFNKLPKDSGIKGVAFFDEKGKIMFMTEKGVQDPKLSNIKRHELSMSLLGSHARGANIQVGPHNVFCMTDNSRTPLEDKLQNFGRSRAKDHKIVLAVPTGDGIATVDQAIDSGVVVGAMEGADNLFRAKKQEVDDIIRREMLDLLIPLAASLDQPGAIPEALFGLFGWLQSSDKQYLVQTNSQDYNTPGNYYKRHGAITRANQTPEDVFKKKVDALKRTAPEEVREHEAVKKVKVQLDALMTELAPLYKEMPARVVGMDGPETELSVDLDTETQVDTEVQINVSEDSKKEPPYYLKWNDYFDRAKFKVHNLGRLTIMPYDSILTGSENVYFASRENWARPIFHRNLHDPGQMPLQFLQCSIDYNGNWAEVRAVDSLDVTENTHQHPGYGIRRPYEFYYNMRTNTLLQDKNHVTKHQLAKLAVYVAQIRFEDGQYQKASYTENQWKELGNWLKGQDLEQAEQYFVGAVLKNRPGDRTKYNGSDLQKLFIELKK